MEYIAPFVTRKEYECPHCGKMPSAFQSAMEGRVIWPTAYQFLFDDFKKIREAWGRPIRINSGYRCPEHNREIGGGLLSVHLFGLALDLDCLDIDEVLALDKLIENMASDLRRGTYIERGTFIHIDVGYFIYPRILKEWHEGARWQG